jgi:hypothetical protein
MLSLTCVLLLDWYPITSHSVPTSQEHDESQFHRPSGKYCWGK